MFSSFTIDSRGKEEARGKSGTNRMADIGRKTNNAIEAPTNCAIHEEAAYCLDMHRFGVQRPREEPPSAFTIQRRFSFTRGEGGGDRRERVESRRHASALLFGQMKSLSGQIFSACVESFLPARDASFMASLEYREGWRERTMSRSTPPRWTNCKRIGSNG